MFVLEFLKIGNGLIAIPHSVAFVLNSSFFPRILLVIVLHLLRFMTLKLPEILSVHSLNVDAVTLPLRNFCHWKFSLCL